MDRTVRLRVRLPAEQVIPKLSANCGDTLDILVEGKEVWVGLKRCYANSWARAIEATVEPQGIEAATLVLNVSRNPLKVFEVIPGIVFGLGLLVWIFGGLNDPTIPKETKIFGSLAILGVTLAFSSVCFLGRYLSRRDDDTIIRIVGQTLQDIDRKSG